MIESTVTAQVDKEITYPCLMRGDVKEVIVLFIKPRNGFILVVNKHYGKVGLFKDNWSMDKFTPLSPDEVVTLKNN